MERANLFNSEKGRLAGVLLTAGLIGGAIDPAAASVSLGATCTTLSISELAS